ncbi:hypothetical protein PR003_g13852 [Phytophthora rubi]|uniref:Nbr1 FW domain-containing protein n=2 Tax=Phytophthora rubi TaxID=129364 RepID=A0A6A4F140_9STRA|nr:hypothetical protein PR002_g13180 [Phytophthora rubi]KAE9333785.1 hypothetical protein PR003_g13852 [Phytophthora rubi]
MGHFRYKSRIYLSATDPDDSFSHHPPAPQRPHQALKPLTFSSSLSCTYATMADDLLQMFQSITTSDHDELVDQFAHLLQLDVHTASFFLESCNWNVETAANNYLATMEASGTPVLNPMEGMDTAGEDLDMEDEGDAPSRDQQQQHQQPNSASFQAQFISDLSASQSTLFAPDTPVQMQWSFVNTGSESWPADTRLLFAQGTSFQGPEQIPVAAPPGQRIDVHAPLLMPSEPGSYAGSWRLHCSGGFFGDPVWVVVNVGTREAAAAFAMQQQQAAAAAGAGAGADPTKFQFAPGDRPPSTVVEDMDL